MAINLVTSQFMTIMQDLTSIDKHSTDLNDCICRLTFLLEGALLFAVGYKDFITATAFVEQYTALVHRR